MISKRTHKNKCGKKIKYKTLDDAKRAAAIFAKKRHIVTILQAYGCHCGGFHFGRTRQIDWDRVK